MKPCAVAAGVPDKQAEATMTALSRTDAELATKSDLKQEFSALKSELKQEIAVFKADLKQEIMAVRAGIAAVRIEVAASRFGRKAALNAAVRKMVFGQIAVAVWLFVAIKLL